MGSGLRSGLGLGLGLGSGLAHGAALVIAAEAHERGDDGLHPDGRLVRVRARARSELHPNGRLHGELAVVGKTIGQ